MAGRSQTTESLKSSGEEEAENGSLNNVCSEETSPEERWRCPDVFSHSVPHSFILQVRIEQLLCAGHVTKKTKKQKTLSSRNFYSRMGFLNLPTAILGWIILCGGEAVLGIVVYLVVSQPLPARPW